MPGSLAREARTAGDDNPSALEHAPRGLGTALVLVLGLILGGGLYLAAVRGDAILLDLAALSGLLFCF